MNIKSLFIALAIAIGSFSNVMAATLDGDEIWGKATSPGATFNIFDPTFTSLDPVSATVDAGTEFSYSGGAQDPIEVLVDFTNDFLTISVEILDDFIIGIADIEYSFDDLDFGPGLQIVGFDVLSNGFPSPPVIITTENSIVIRFDEYDVDGPELRSFTGQFIVSEVPLPAALPLFLAGLAGVGLVGRKSGTK
ncbi:VPLPA-CTERM sorting domain-containing protein [Hyphococcus formosus]|uniref:VPLPA-CTERM sorting domain-containing protein n=1 Tax=Hyphococcus formosus TaxID=3143534 RepID=UPI00398B5B66